MVRQLLINALIAGSLYALIGIGFALIFRVVKFFHFTHGLSYALGAYVAFGLSRWSNLNLVWVLILAPIITAVFGVILYAIIFQPLRNRRATPLVSLIACLGAYLVGQNLLSMAFGDDAKSIRGDVVVLGMNVLGAYITLPQLVIVVFAIVVVLGCAVWLSKTELGTQIRAVANDPSLATIIGIASDRVVFLTVVVGTGLGGLAGGLAALDRAIVPTMGLNALLMGVVATIAGGKESLGGVAFGAYFVGLAQNMVILWIPSAWQDSIVFLIMIGFLILRPQGFMGRDTGRSAF